MLDVVAQSRSLDSTGHRPFPRPPGSWMLGQTWRSLLFLHWPVTPALLRHLVPAGLELDIHGGTAWISVTPFRLTGLRVRGTLPLPALSTFLEVNVRTYVTLDGRPGIWFLSLDGSSRLAVRAARAGFHLPYRDADASMSQDAASGRTRWRSEPRGDRACGVLECEYAPVGDACTAKPGSLDHFLAERYCLYSSPDGRQLYRADIHHGPWQLQPADCDIADDSLLTDHLPQLVDVAARPELVRFTARQDVLTWLPIRVG